MMFVPPERATCVPHWSCPTAASSEPQLFAHWHLPQQHRCSATHSRGHLRRHTAQNYRSPSMPEKLKRNFKVGICNFGINKRGLLRLTSSSAWQGAVELTRIHPIFKDGICHDHLILPSTSGTAAVKPQIRLSDWVSSWSRWQNFWWRPPLRRTTVTIINEQQLTNS